MKNVFRRITSTGHYMPEVDGLRFIAVTSVLLLHAHAWLKHNLDLHDLTQVPGLSALDPWLMRGGYGVEIFFIISGFILSLPLLRGIDFSYRKYLMRRLTRLEPPYLISLSLIFLAMLFAGKYTFSELWPEMLASMAYLNNLIFPEHLPLVNGVSWSLEIEVQFYLLCPVIGLLLRRNKYQILYYLGLLLIALVVQKWFEPAFLSLLSVGSYFLLGILLAYAYLRKPLFTPSPMVRDVMAVASFGLIWLLLVPIGKDRSGAFPWFLLEHLNLFLFFYLVVVLKALPKFFTAPVVATIGGMCYSIYLLHFALFAVMGRAILWLDLFNTATSTYYTMMVVLIVAAVAISSVFYLILERPFMRRDWHRTWLTRMRGRMGHIQQRAGNWATGSTPRQGADPEGLVHMNTRSFWRNGSRSLVKSIWPRSKRTNAPNPPNVTP